MLSSRITNDEQSNGEVVEIPFANSMAFPIKTPQGSQFRRNWHTVGKKKKEVSVNV